MTTARVLNIVIAFTVMAAYPLIESWLAKYLDPIGDRLAESIRRYGERKRAERRGTK